MLECFAREVLFSAAHTWSKVLPFFYMVTFLTISKQERKISTGCGPTGTSGMCKVF